MANQSRDETIRRALDRLKVARWTELQSETGFSAQKLTAGLESLEDEIIHVGKLYALKKHRDRLKERLASEAPREKVFPRSHVRTVASGLLALVFNHRYLMEGEPIPRPENIPHALKYLETGYGEIYLLYCDMGNLEREIDSNRKKLLAKLKRRVEDKGIAWATFRNIPLFIDGFAVSSGPPRITVDRTIRVEPRGTGWQVEGGGYVISSVMKEEEARFLEKSIKESFIKTLTEEVDLVLGARSLHDHLSDIREDFKTRVSALVERLLHTRRLRAEFRDCRRHSRTK
jgi:hypothetical protein